MNADGKRYEFSASPSKKIGNRDFDVMKATRSINGTESVKQLYCSRIDKGFALSFIISYLNDAQEDELMDILHSVKTK